MAALQRFPGQFAFALVGRARAYAYARPRPLAEKPLFYVAGAGTTWSSRRKSGRRWRIDPAWSASLDRAALTSFMRYAYVPAPSSIWTGIQKMPSASYVTFGGGVARRQHAQRQSLIGPCVRRSRLRRPNASRDEVRRSPNCNGCCQSRSSVNACPMCRSGHFYPVESILSTIVALMQAPGSEPAGSHLHHRLRGRRLR